MQVDDETKESKGGNFFESIVCMLLSNPLLNYHIIPIILI